MLPKNYRLDVLATGADLTMMNPAKHVKRAKNTMVTVKNKGGEVGMTGIIKLGDITAYREKPIYSTQPNGIAYKITIAFAKELSDKKLRQLAALAKWVQDKEENDADNSI